jgi:hypothetical protein
MDAIPLDDDDDVIDMAELADEDPPTESKSYAWHKTVGEAGGFLDELSRAKDFGMKHQKMCKTHGEALRGIVGVNGPEDDDEENLDDDSELGGEMGEKLLSLERMVKSLKAAI